jgi:hypothetical protein
LRVPIEVLLLIGVRVPVKVQVTIAVLLPVEGGMLLLIELEVLVEVRVLEIFVEVLHPSEVRVPIGVLVPGRM